MGLCEHSVIGTLAVTEPPLGTFMHVHLTEMCGPTKGRAMYLLILLPLFLLASLAGIFSLMFEDPDRVASNYSPYVEISK